MKNKHFVLIVAGILAALFVIYRLNQNQTQTTKPQTPPESPERTAFMDLIRTHPRKDMREDILRLMEARELYPVFIEGKQGAAVEELAHLEYVQTRAKRTVLTIQINKRYLLNANEPLAMKQITLFHEWLHIKQISDGRFPRSIATPNPPGYVPTREDLRTFFEAEAEAHKETCAFAESINALSLTDFCATLQEEGERSFRMHIALMFSSFPYYAPHKDTLLAIAFQHM